MSEGGLAVLVAAHSRYISNMHKHMLLGSERPSIVARTHIEELYEVVCTVGRVTDGLLIAPSSSAVGRSPGEGTPTIGREREEEMIFPDRAFTELASARVRFDTARRGLCGALVDISTAGGGARARPLLAILGYGGYAGSNVA